MLGAFAQLLTSVIYRRRINGAEGSVFIFISLHRATTSKIFMTSSVHFVKFSMKIEVIANTFRLYNGLEKMKRVEGGEKITFG